VYLRSALGIQWFPRVALALVLLYHFYLYAHPGGFHLLALLTTFLLLFHAMIYTVRKYELPSFMRGEVSEAAPRSAFATLPYAAWDTPLSPDLTMFMPVNERAASLYATAVPGAPTAAGAGTGVGTPAVDADAEFVAEAPREAVETDPLLPRSPTGASFVAEAPREAVETDPLLPRSPTGASSMEMIRLTWPDLTWPDLTWPDLTWPDLTWPDLTWPDLTWPDLIWSDLNLIWSESDLIWPNVKFVK
jgi:hypothetical protein